MMNIRGGESSHSLVSHSSNVSAQSLIQESILKYGKPQQLLLYPAL